MKLFSVLIVIYALVPGIGWACDVCSPYYGILPQDRSHQLSVNYLYTRLQGYHNIPNGVADQPNPLFKTQHDPSLHQPGGPARESAGLFARADYELYHTWELSGRLWLGKRWQLGAAVPLRQTRAQVGQGTPTRLRTGLADARLGAWYYPLWTDTDSLSLQLGLGAELQLPTGRFATQAPEATALLQPGMAAWGGLGHLLLRLRYLRWGSQLQLQYRHTAPNPDQIQYLGAFNGQWQLFYQLGQRLRVLPSLGLAYEHTAGVSYRGEWLSGTGGRVLSGQVGASCYTGPVAWQLLLSRPIAQHYRGTQLGLGGRIQLGISYFIPSRRA